MNVRASVLVCVAFFIFGFKPSTHMYSANSAIEDLFLGYTISLDGGVYEVETALYDSIAAYANYYRGGVVGPDGFPDILFDQGKIHPDLLCNNGADECQWPPGTSFT